MSLFAIREYLASIIVWHIKSIKTTLITGIQFYNGSLSDIYFVGPKNKTSWSMNMRNFYVMIPDGKSMMFRVEEQSGMDILPDDLLTFLKTQNITNNIKDPKLSYRDPTVDIDKKRSILSYPVQATFILSESDYTRKHSGLLGLVKDVWIKKDFLLAGGEK